MSNKSLCASTNNLPAVKKSAAVIKAGTHHIQDISGSICINQCQNPVASQPPPSHFSHFFLCGPSLKVALANGVKITPQHNNQPATGNLPPSNNNKTQIRIRTSGHKKITCKQRFNQHQTIMSILVAITEILFQVTLVLALILMSVPAPQGPSVIVPHDTEKKEEENEAEAPIVLRRSPRLISHQESSDNASVDTFSERIGRDLHLMSGISIARKNSFSTLSALSDGDFELIMGLSSLPPSLPDDPLNAPPPVSP